MCVHEPRHDDPVGGINRWNARHRERRANGDNDAAAHMNVSDWLIDSGPVHAQHVAATDEEFTAGRPTRLGRGLRGGAKGYGKRRASGLEKLTSVYAGRVDRLKRGLGRPRVHQRRIARNASRRLWQQVNSAERQPNSEGQGARERHARVGETSYRGRRHHAEQQEP